MRNRRQNERLPARSKVFLTYGGVSYPMTVCDVSTTGAFLSTRDGDPMAMFRLFEPIAIAFPSSLDAGIEVQIRARIARLSTAHNPKGPGIGVEFAELTEHELTEVMRLAIDQGDGGTQVWDSPLMAPGKQERSDFLSFARSKRAEGGS